jgi:long-chain fatty acid transport protein
MKLRAARVAAALLAPAAAAPLGAAGAQGFGLNEIGTCAVAKAGANTSAPCADASSLYWNPGAVGSVPTGTTVYASGSAIAISGRFRQDNTGRAFESTTPVGAPPFLGFTVHTVPRLVLGVAGYVPYGLTSQWNDDFPGRFSAQKVALQTFYLQPTAAYELIPGRLSVGAGAVAAYSRLQLRQSLDFSQQFAAEPSAANPAGVTFRQLGFATGTEFGRARVQGSGTGVGYNLGAQAKLTDRVAVGARYLSKVRIRYDDARATFTVSPRAGDVVFRSGPVTQPGGPGDPFLNTVNPGRVAVGLPALGAGSTLADLVLPNFVPGAPLGPGQTASTEITHPAQIQGGVSYTSPRNTLSVEYANIRYTSFDRLPITFTRADGVRNAPLSRTLLEEYGNSNSVRVGGEHRTRGGVAGRLGFSYIRTPAPDQTVTPLLPDMDRYNFSAGVGVPLRGGRYVLDAGFLRVETEGRRGRTAERTTETAAQTVSALNNGFYELTANVFSVGLKARF